MERTEDIYGTSLVIEAQKIKSHRMTFVVSTEEPREEENSVGECWEGLEVEVVTAGLEGS
jgi:hypothetical protein